MHISLDREAVLTYPFNAYKKENAMPRAAVDDNNRVALRSARRQGRHHAAAALEKMDMTTFILRTALREAQSVIEEHERCQAHSTRQPTGDGIARESARTKAKLRKAARGLPERS